MSTGNVTLKFGEAVQINCRPGYVLSEGGVAAPRCRDDGSFEQGKTCEKIELRSGHCGALPPVLHATTDPPGRIFVGKSATITCNAGYKPLADHHQPPNYSPFPPPALSHTHTFDAAHVPTCISSIGAEQVGGRFRETADMQGYMESETVSLPHAHFSHAFAGSCVPRSCGSYQAPPHSHVTPTGPIAFGEFVKISCNAGFVYGNTGRATPACVESLETVGFEEGCFCVPGASIAVVLRQSYPSGKVQVSGRTVLAHRGVLSLTTSVVWPWLIRDSRGDWRKSRKCQRMPGYITCLSAPPQLGARGVIIILRIIILSVLSST
jgi:hypothetical protein